MSAVVVTPAAVTLRSIGETVTLSAVARDEDGKDIPGKTFVWATSDDHVLALSAPVATAMANGEATISATTDGVTGTAAIQVRQAVASVEVTPGTSTLVSIGETVQLTATPRDARNNAIITSAARAWASSAPSVATVDPGGSVSAAGDGTATVTATIDGVGGGATVKVTQTPARLAFLAQPTTSQMGVPVLAARVSLQDARGHTVVRSSDAVSLALGQNPGGATLTGDGARTVAAVAGVATFTRLAVDQPGSGYTLVASSGSLPPASSAAFDVITGPARFDELNLSSTTVAIGGLSVPYTAMITNASGRNLEVAGVQAWIEQGSVVSAAGGSLVHTCGAPVGVLPPGTCRFGFTIGVVKREDGTSPFQPGPATARFDLFAGSRIIESKRVAIVLETFVPPPTPAARIAEVKLSATTLTIGGESVSYTATLINESESTVTNVGVQGLIVQGSTVRAAGGAVVQCGAELGVFPPGSCTFGFTLVASNTVGGTGTLVPGPATARLDLFWLYGILATYSVPITLVH